MLQRRNFQKGMIEIFLFSNSQNSLHLDKFGPYKSGMKKMKARR
jgi:hypothetical protein